ncbi:MAG TPA: FAD-dependent monooxygenase [Polyangiaceae bacterium]|nr:FAD-dependent monooxygenase [Polyangiaceae bacterium]
MPCLIVGAGPTGLTLAAQLRWFGVPFRIIDRSLDRAHESRALAVQARTLEILDSLNLGDALVARGNTSARLVIHFGSETIASTTLGGIGAAETRYPFILFVSQAETERLLGEHLASSGVAIERGVELSSYEATDEHVECVLRHTDGHAEHVRASYLFGCDGAHSFVRRTAGFSFEGGSYPQDFALGDVEAEGQLENNAINSFANDGGIAMFFPLGTPTTWRVIGMRPQGPRPARDGTESVISPIGPLRLEELQSIVSLATGGSVVVRDPAWLSNFRLHHRQVARYRQGRVFLAGDAAHIHSPVGAQGMNTGMQDAWNLGWKVALVLRGDAKDELLDSYDAERWPVGRTLLQYTDRIFSTFTRAMSAGAFAAWARKALVARLMPKVFDSPALRSRAFMFVSELGIQYRRSPIVSNGRPQLRGGPRAGDRLPDAQLKLGEEKVPLHRAVIGPGFGLLLCGDAARWSRNRLDQLARRYRLAKVAVLSNSPLAGVLVDEDGRTLASLAAENGAQYLVRPDGYVAFRCSGYELGAVEAYLAASTTLR